MILVGNFKRIIDFDVLNKQRVNKYSIYTDAFGNKCPKLPEPVIPTSVSASPDARNSECICEACYKACDCNTQFAYSLLSLSSSSRTDF